MAKLNFDPMILEDLADSLMAAIVADTFKVPARQTFYPGPIVDDCSQCAIAVRNISRGLPPGGEIGPVNCVQVYTVNYVVRLAFDCAPMPSTDGKKVVLPSAAALTAYTKDIWHSGITFLGAIGGWAADKRHTCTAIDVGILEPLLASGDFKGWEINVAVQL